MTRLRTFVGFSNVLHMQMNHTLHVYLWLGSDGYEAAKSCTPCLGYGHYHSSNLTCYGPNLECSPRRMTKQVIVSSTHAPQQLALRAEPQNPGMSMFASVAQPQTCVSAAAPVPFTRTGQAKHTNLAHHTEHGIQRKTSFMCTSEEQLTRLRTNASDSMIKMPISTRTAMRNFQRTTIAQAASTSQSTPAAAASIGLIGQSEKGQSGQSDCYSFWPQMPQPAYVSRNVQKAGAPILHKQQICTV